MWKKVLLIGALLLGFVGCAAVTTPVKGVQAVADDSYPTHVDFDPQADAYKVAGLSVVEVYPDNFNDALFYCAPNNGDGIVEWCLTGITFSVENGVFSWDVLYWSAYYRSNWTWYGETVAPVGYPCSFIFGNQSGQTTNYVAVSFGAPFVFNAPKFGGPSALSYSASQFRLKSSCSFGAPNTSGPYAVGFEDVGSNYDFFDELAYYYGNLVVGQAGYSQGFDAGRTAGYDAGHDAGYSSGLEDGAAATPSNVIMSVVRAIFAVPENVLNGLGGFVIWDTPVLAIILTLLFSAFALLIIKKAL